MTLSIDVRRFEKIKATGELPSPRGVAIAIIREAQRTEVSMADLARVIKGDPAFVGRLVKAANGLVAENRRAVVSVQEALMVLGLPAVRSMALGFSLLSNYRRGACRSFDYEAFWSAALLMGLAMKLVSQRAGAMAPDEAFSLGLLASIGELALATLYPVEYGAVLDEVRRCPSVRRVDLERRALAIDSRELSAAMLVDWGIPATLASAVQNFAEPDPEAAPPGSRDERLMCSLALAEAMAQLYFVEPAEHAKRIGGLYRLAGRLGIERSDFAYLCERMNGEWIEWTRLLNMKAGEVPHFDGLFAEMPVGQAGEAASEGQAERVAPMRILLVTAAQDATAKQLSAELEAFDFELYRVENGDQASVAMVDVQPQLMLIDWQAPGCGESLVRVIRETRLGRATYIIALFDADDADSFAAAADAGVDDFLSRPLSSGVLRMRLRVGRRMVQLQRELEAEREELQRFAAELSISNRRLQEAAMTDPLTGFPNRRYLNERLQMEWSSALRHNRALSVMIIDLDGFKTINDEHGHDVGDITLRQCADAMRAAIRVQDVVCRSGGDEFLAICPDTDLNAAVACAERLREAVAQLRVDTGSCRLRVTISIGVASREATMSSADELVKRADQGAYCAKQAGRNRVVAMPLRTNRRH